MKPCVYTQKKETITIFGGCGLLQHGGICPLWAGYVYRDDAENAIFSGVNSPNAAEIIFMPAFLMRLPEKIIMFLAF